MITHDFFCKGCGGKIEVYTESIRDTPVVPYHCGQKAGKDFSSVQIAPGEVVASFWSNGMGEGFDSQRKYKDAMKKRSEELERRTGNKHEFVQTGGSDEDHGVNREEQITQVGKTFKPKPIDRNLIDSIRE